MHVDHHPLMNDFPELRSELQALRMNDNHFARLAEEYEVLDKRICRIEDGIELLDDAALGQLKTERVQRKDEIAELLRKAAKPACCGSCCG